jgi:hypothetical protein
MVLGSGPIDAALVKRRNGFTMRRSRGLYNDISFSRHNIAGVLHIGRRFRIVP